MVAYPAELGQKATRLVVNTALRPQKPDGLLGTERSPLTSSDTQSREFSAAHRKGNIGLYVHRNH